METTLTIILCSYEIVIRIIPTRKNFSIVDNTKNLMWGLHDVFDRIIPNARKK